MMLLHLSQVSFFIERSKNLPKYLEQMALIFDGVQYFVQPRLFFMIEKLIRFSGTNLFVLLFDLQTVSLSTTFHDFCHTCT